MEAQQKEKQRKITESWKRLPEFEKRQLKEEETRRRRLELRDAKINIWKRWRRKEEEPRTRTKDEENRDWLEKIEKTLEKIRKEEESKKEARRVNKERRDALLAEQKMRQEEILRKEQESKERKIRQNTLQKRWEMMRWVTKYIDENSDKWKIEKETREQNIQQILPR